MPWYRDYMGTFSVDADKIVCVGKHTYKDGVLTIYDTEITTYRAKLIEFLQV